MKERQPEKRSITGGDFRITIFNKLNYLGNLFGQAKDEASKVIIERQMKQLSELLEVAEIFEQDNEASVRYYETDGSVEIDIFAKQPIGFLDLKGGENK